MIKEVKIRKEKNYDDEALIKWLLKDRKRFEDQVNKSKKNQLKKKDQ